MEVPLGAGTIDANLAIIMSLDWGGHRDARVERDTVRIRAEVLADLPKYLERFRRLMGEALASWLASHQASAFVDLVEEMDAAGAKELRTELLAALERAHECLREPGGRTRLRTQIAEIDLVGIVREDPSVVAP